MTENRKTKAIAKAVAFTGHRKVHHREMVAERLKEAVLQSYRNGTTIYYSGMALGFDMLAAEVILSLQVSLPFLKLIAVVPFRGQSALWPMAEQQRYARILSQADEVILLSENYFNGCYLRRNDYMLSHSDNVIAYYDGKPMGGTAYTCRKARKKQMEIVNVF